MAPPGPVARGPYAGRQAQPVRATPSMTYSFAQQLPAPLPGMSSAPVPPTSSIPQPSSRAPQNSRTANSLQSYSQHPSLSGTSSGPSSATPSSSTPAPSAPQPPVGRWAAGVPKPATAAEIVANSGAGNARPSVAEDAESGNSLADQELALYSRLVPTTSVIPRTPRSAPPSSAGRRASNAIGTAASASANSAGSSAGLPQSGISKSSSPMASGSGSGASRSGMKSLVSVSSSDQLARRAGTPLTKPRRSLSPTELTGSGTSNTSVMSGPAASIFGPSGVSAGHVGVLPGVRRGNTLDDGGREREREREIEISPGMGALRHTANQSPSPTPPGGNGGTSSSSASRMSPHNGPSAQSQAGRQFLTRASPARSTATAAGHSAHGGTRSVLQSGEQGTASGKPGAPAPVPLRKGQIETLRSKDQGGRSVLSAGSSAVGIESDGVFSERPSRHLGTAGTGTSETRSSPPLRPMNSRVDALRESRLTKSSTSAQTPKNVQLSRANMGVSLGMARNSMEGPTRSSYDQRLSARENVSAERLANGDRPSSVSLASTEGAQASWRAKQVSPAKRAGGLSEGSSNAVSSLDLGGMSVSGGEAGGTDESIVMETGNGVMDGPTGQHVTNGTRGVNGMNGMGSMCMLGQGDSSNGFPWPHARSDPIFGLRSGETGKPYLKVAPTTASSSPEATEAKPLHGMPLVSSGMDPRTSLSSDGLNVSPPSLTTVSESLPAASEGIAPSNLSLASIHANPDAIPYASLSASDLSRYMSVEDGLLPPLPNSEQDGDRFEDMLRSMGWQPLDDDEGGGIADFR